MKERAFEQLPDETLREWCRIATDRRMGALIEAFRRGWTIEQVYDITSITRWFLHRFQKIAMMEDEILQSRTSPSELSIEQLIEWKSHGFTDGHIADALSGFPGEGYKSLAPGMDERAVMMRRHELGVHPRFRMVDSCAAEFAAKTPYYYSTYELNTSSGIDHIPDLQNRTKERIVTIGSGPIRIGQGIEFDYGCVHAVKAIRDAGKDAILINNNPETVSTDFDTSDRLYFDPLTLEYVSEILLREMAHGILLQFGGQTAINLAGPLERRLPDLRIQGLELSIIGTSYDAIDEASDRKRFEEFAQRHQLRMPRGATGSSADDIRKAVETIGFPVLIRPSYVLGGRGMEILSNDQQLDNYLNEAYIAPDKPLLIDEYLGHATDCLLYTSPSPRDQRGSRMPSSA